MSPICFLLIILSISNYCSASDLFSCGRLVSTLQTTHRQSGETDTIGTESVIGSPTGRYLSISKHHKTPHKVWLHPSLLQTQTAGTKFPTARLLCVTKPLQFYSQLLRSIGSLMNVSVSTDALHSPVCVFYVDSSLPWPAESAVSGPSDPPCILCNSSTLSVASTDIPPPHFTKGYQCLVLSPSEPPPPIIFFFF